jgi:hypothetical protein
MAPCWTMVIAFIHLTFTNTVAAGKLVSDAKWNLAPASASP